MSAFINLLTYLPPTSSHGGVSVNPYPTLLMVIRLRQFWGLPNLTHKPRIFTEQSIQGHQISEKL